MAGRQRDDRIDAIVLETTQRLLGEVGYAELSIGRIASEAGQYRPAIYRRWPSKRHLVVDVVARMLGEAPTPNTGDLRADLVSGMRTIVTALRDTPLGRILPALVADLAADPELAQHFLHTVFAPRRESTAARLRAAVGAGELDTVPDVEFVLDALAAPIYYRALFGHQPLDDSLAEQTVDTVLAAATKNVAPQGDHESG